jgi:thiamine-phosphate pyrophosphorylase
MSPRPLLCYITDRTQFAIEESARRNRLLAKIAEAGRAGVDYIQLREKDLFARELEELAEESIRVLQDEKRRAGNREQKAAFLINSRTDVALAVGALGVHLRSDDITPADVRHICSTRAKGSVCLMIGQSCHHPNDVQQAATNGADLALFAPVFEKKDSPNAAPTGLEALRRACQHDIPVLALGGVTLENAARCLEAGAAGIAAIRLFQDHDIAEIVQRLKAL